MKKRINTQLLKLNQEQIDTEVLAQAEAILRAGGLVAFPTETVYGLGGDAFQEEASKKIYAAKGRPSDNPLIVHIGQMEDVDVIAGNISEQARQAMKTFWPGPLTVVLEKKEIVPDSTTGGLKSVAVRMPDNPITLALLRKTGIFMAGPSANSSGKPSPTTAKHVQDDLDGKIDMILDGGAAGLGIESTIVDFTGEVPVILRPGFITAERLSQVMGIEVDIDPSITEEGMMDDQLKPKAPGMKYKHYAPKADMILVEGFDMERVLEKVQQLVEEAQDKGLKVGVMTTIEHEHRYNKADVVKSVGSRQEDATVAAGLYRVLREFDESDVDVIYSEAFQQGELSQAIMNRLLKAAGHQVLYAE